MQQRQLRLGDILDDYCPRERRVTNHAVVAMVGPDVKQTRCTTCDADHEYKQAKMPRLRRKAEATQPGGPQPVGAPARAGVERPAADADHPEDQSAAMAAAPAVDEGESASADHDVEAAIEPAALGDDDGGGDVEEGPVHRPLIRATLPRPEGQPPPARPAPDFTIRQPAGRANRFRPRQARGPQPFQGNRSNGNSAGGAMRGGPHSAGGRPPQGGMASRPARRHNGPGRKRSK